MVFESHNSLYLYNKNLDYFNQSVLKNIILKILFFFHYYINPYQHRFMSCVQNIKSCSYKGLRLIVGYPLRGQRTRIHARTAFKLKFIGYVAKFLIRVRLSSRQN